MNIFSTIGYNWGGYPLHGWAPDTKRPRKWTNWNPITNPWKYELTTLKNKKVRAFWLFFITKTCFFQKIDFSISDFRLELMYSFIKLFVFLGWLDRFNKMLSLFKKWKCIAALWTATSSRSENAISGVFWVFGEPRVTSYPTFQK